MIVDRCATLEPHLQHLDHLLDDDAIFHGMKHDLAQRYPLSLTKGRHSTPVEVILRTLAVKRMYQWNYEVTEQFVLDSLVLRPFWRIYREDVPDGTTQNLWVNLITPATLEAIHERVMQLAHERKVTRGRKLRVDSAVVETMLHHPPDSSLLADGVRVLSRLVRRAKAILGSGPELGRAAFRTRMRSVRSLKQELNRVARRKGEEAVEELTGTHRRLVEAAKQSCAQGRRVAAALTEWTEQAAQHLTQELDDLLPPVEQEVIQTERRVIHGAKLSAEEKLVSLFEPHNQMQDFRAMVQLAGSEGRRRLYLGMVGVGLMCTRGWVVSHTWIGALEWLERMSAIR